MKKEMNKVAVVTITYNAEKYIKRTIFSVLHQNYDEYEYIIIDGGSNDNTMKIVKSYKKAFEEKGITFKYISEKDNGRVDAINKSINLANSKYVNFLHAGDFYCDANVLNRIFSSCTEDVDVIYGSYYLYSNRYRKYVHSRTIETLPQAMICTHQAIFTKLDLIKNRKFDEDVIIVNDYDFYLDMYSRRKTFEFIDTPVVYYEINGISAKSIHQSVVELIDVRHRYGFVNDKERLRENKKVIPKCLFKRIVRCIPYKLKGYEIFSVNSTLNKEFKNNECKR